MRLGTRPGRDHSSQGHERGSGPNDRYEARIWGSRAFNRTGGTGDAVRLQWLFLRAFCWSEMIGRSAAENSNGKNLTQQTRKQTASPKDLVMHFDSIAATPCTSLPFPPHCTQLLKRTRTEKLLASLPDRAGIAETRRHHAP